MKTLLLLRHAKAEAHDPRRDFDRELAKRGRRDAPEAAAELLRQGVVPDVVVSSPAARARQTAEAVCDAAGWATAITWQPDVYEAELDTLVGLVSELPAGAQTALLVGHNPGLYVLGALLAPGQMPDLPTAGLVCLELASDAWDEIAPGDGIVRWSWTPKGGASS